MCFLSTNISAKRVIRIILDFYYPFFGINDSITPNKSTKLDKRILIVSALRKAADYHVFGNFY